MPLLSLPFDILDLICQQVSRDATSTTFWRSTDTEPPGFIKFYNTRRPKDPTPFQARLVCRELNHGLTPHLFRDIYIRLGWDWLHINPPLRELATDTNNVFNKYAKALRIGPIIKGAKSRFLRVHDVDRDHDSLIDIPLEIYDVYPDPKAAWQKEEELQRVAEDVKMYIARAIAALSNVEELVWELHETEYPDWFHEEVTRGLCTLRNIRRVRLACRNNGRTRDSAPIPLFRGIVAFPMTLHHLAHLELDFDQRVPPDHDLFWKAMHTAQVALVSVRTNAIRSAAVVDYIASYSGAEVLSFGHRTITVAGSSSRDMAERMFGAVLEQHATTLRVFGLPVTYDDTHSWGIDVGTAQRLVRCTSLRSISVMFCVWPQEIDVTAASFALLMGHLSQLTLLCTVELIAIRVQRSTDVWDARLADVPSTADIMHAILADFLACRSIAHVPGTLRLHIDILSDMTGTFEFYLNAQGTQYWTLQQTYEDPDYFPSVFPRHPPSWFRTRQGSSYKERVQAERAGRPRLSL